MMSMHQAVEHSCSCRRQRAYCGGRDSLAGQHQSSDDNALHVVSIAGNGPLVCKEREAKVPADIFDAGKSGAEDIRNSVGLHKRNVQSGVERHRSNPVLLKQATPTQASCAGKSSLAIRWNRTAARSAERNRMQPSQRNARSTARGVNCQQFQAVEALRGGKA